MILNPSITASPADKQFQMSARGEGNRVRLRHESGLFLNIDGSGLTRRADPGGCYVARQEQAERMRATNELAAGCQMVEA
jgi:hypothetical protein